MRIFAWLARAALLGLTTACIGLWVTVMTAQSTVLNRTVVKGWLADSGAYDHVLDSLINLQSISGDQTLDQASLRKAVSNTLTPSFIKQTSETALDSTYDWLEGKSPTISFSIPLTDKRTELQNQLAAALGPALQSLPACTSGFSGLSSSDVKCIPQGTSAQDAANTTAQQAIQGTDFLTQPLTQNSLGQMNLQSLSWLPTIVQSVGWLSIGLPIAAILCGAGYVLLSERRLLGGRALAGHILFGSVLGLLLGTSLWYFGGSLQVSQVADQPSQATLLNDVVQPILHQVLPSVGLWLSIFAGSVVLASGIAWGALIYASHKSKEHHALQDAEDSQPMELPKPVAIHHPQPAPQHVTTETPKPPTKPVGQM